MTRAECEASALLSYNAGIQRCNSLSYASQPGCRTYELVLYRQQMGYCSQIPPDGGKTPVIETSRPGVLEGWMPSLLVPLPKLPKFLDGWF